jgi:hypothetical protein
MRTQPSRATRPGQAGLPASHACHASHALRPSRNRLLGIALSVAAVLTVGLAPALVTGLSRTAHAAPPPPAPPSGGGGIPQPVDTATDLVTAEKFYADLDYDRANLVAARIVGGKGMSHSQLMRGLRVLALTDAALGHEDQAREEFIDLLTYSADFQVDPNLGPRVTAPFLEARGFWRAQPEKPGVEVAVTVHPDGPGTLRVITRDPTHIVKSGAVGFRWGTSVPYTTLPLAVSGGGDGVVFDIPERPANVARLDYYAQVFDERDNAVMEVGNPTAPKSYLVDVPKAAPVAAATQKKSIFASPIFWTVAGVVVAGAAATTTYLVTRPKAATGATLTSGAQCGSVATAGMLPTMCH